MVATVGSISIDLSTNAAKFATGMRGAATTVERESGRMSKSLAAIERSSSLALTALKGFGTGILAGAGLGSLTGLIGKARDAIGQLDDIADRAKSSGLGTDLLQSLEHGAQQAGVEVDTLSGGLQFFAKGMGQAAEGTGRLYSGLLKLNPELLRSLLHATDQEERLKAVANALDKTRTATERAALSAALFGDVDFGRLFEGGAAGIDKMVAAMDGKLFTPEQIKRAGEYDTKLNDISREIDHDLTESLVKLGPLLVGAAELFKSGSEAAVNYIERIDQLGGSLDRLARDPSRANLADVLIGPKGGGNLLGFLRGAEESLVGIRKEIAETTTDIADMNEEAKNFPKDWFKTDIDKLLAHLEVLERKLASVGNTARSAFAEAFRESENASMAALAAMHPQAPPRAIGGGSVDQDIMDDVEKAIDKGTAATGAGLSRVERAVQSSGASIAGALSYSVPAGGGYATGDAANSFKFSGGGRDSWSGRRMTFGGGGGGGYSGPMASNYDYYSAALNRPMGARAAMDTSSITPGGGAPAASVVNVVVKPVMAGERLSVQSRAEIKQAAAEGANAALRAFNGR